MVEAFRFTGVHEGSSWTLAYEDDHDENASVKAFLSDQSAARIWQELGGDSSKGPKQVGDAIAKVASALTREQGAEIEISDAEVDKFLMEA